MEGSGTGVDAALFSGGGGGGETGSFLNDASIAVEEGEEEEAPSSDANAAKEPPRAIEPPALLEGSDAPLLHKGSCEETQLKIKE